MAHAKLFSVSPSHKADQHFIKMQTRLVTKRQLIQETSQPKVGFSVAAAEYGEY